MTDSRFFWRVIGAIIAVMLLSVLGVVLIMEGRI